MSLKITRAIVDAVHEGVLDNAEFEKFPVFGFEIPKSIPGIDSKILNPKNTWSNKEEYDQVLKKLGSSFAKNFKKFSAQCDDETKAADCQA